MFDKSEHVNFGEKKKIDQYMRQAKQLLVKSGFSSDQIGVKIENRVLQETLFEKRKKTITQL